MRHENGFDEEDYDRRKNWKIGSADHGTLDVEEYLGVNEGVLYMESEIFEELLGYTADELLERIDDAYGTSISDKDVEDYEYGDGWALFHVEE